MESVMSDSLWPHGPYSLWNSPGQNTGVGSLSLLQGIFPTQGSNPGLQQCRRILYQLSHKGSPTTLERIDYLFSRSSWPRNWTRVSCIAGGFFTSWAIREALNPYILSFQSWGKGTSSRFIFLKHFFPKRFYPYCFHYLRWYSATSSHWSGM